ncbi:hypothetical protein BDN70DRAFT_876684 [Pholiota conissans]|uniref:PH domain-containing protein n=1 Tax=Pholiota conissans TaxID=109636 RepID=A0A9P5Z5H1_9AGAR|nr:hypothetical protein BDN70DRAFT_876684 [Pholiota conissans]
MATTADAQYTNCMPPISSGPSSSSFPRTTSLPPRRIGSPPQEVFTVERGLKLSKMQTEAVSKARSNTKSNEKGKEPVRAYSIGESPSTPLARDHYVPHYNNGKSPYTNSNEARRPSTSDGGNNNLNGRSKFRGSLLAASDALGLKFGRRRHPIRSQPTPNILTDVIEITNHRADAEDEERNRLREMAAHAIGVDPYMASSDSHSRSGEPESATDENDDFVERWRGSDAVEARRLGGHLNGRNPNSESASNIGGRRSPHGSSLSVSIPPHNPKPPQPPPGSRFRSGSMAGAGHSPSNSVSIMPIPPFPATVADLSQFHESSGMFPKYYPPSSLRIFALSKNWKSRYILLSKPATFVTKNRTPAVSYLHLFKSSGEEEKELERLEINEDSVVFVSEEEVGGKRHVIKVGGADVGAMKKEYTHEEGGHIMWLLQISDQTVAQKWITNIKHAILGQRTVRAGLIPPVSLGNNEPRGDMDVMMSVIRAQGTPASPTSTTFKQSMAPTQADSSGSIANNLNYASSISSHSARSQSPPPKVPASPASAVSALKGLFATSVGRPRSGSRATSISSERHADAKDEESFTSMGSNLLSMLRSSTPDTQSINTVQSATRTTNSLPFATAVPTPPLERRIDRRILTDPQQVASWTSVSPEMANASSSKDTLKMNKGFLLGAMSLQPPPRKRWTSGLTESAHRREEKEPETPKADSVRRVSFTASRTSTDRMSVDRQTQTDSLNGFQFGTPEQRPRAPSLQSVSTFGSGDNGMNMDRSSSSTKRSSGTRSARRWSRQGILPNRSTPPSDPPPAVPDHARSVHPYASAEHSGGGSANGSAQSSEKSVVSNLPTFSKRASGSSQRSINSFSTTYSHPASVASSHHPPRTSSSHRTSIVPPPRPAPTSALPPAPTDNSAQDTLKPLEESPGSSKSSFRNSVGPRTFRLSMVAPLKPPPSTTLPPRPDELEYKTRRRSSSGSNNAPSPNASSPQSTKLEPIPASPVPPAKTVNPFPPPVGPLPPPPTQLDATSTSSSNQQEQTVLPPPKRSASITIKERLRKLSAPLPSGNQSQVKVSPLSRSQTQTSNAFMPDPTQTILMNPLTTIATSQPATPIAEKITLFQNDPSFLQMHTPILPTAPPPIAMTSLYSSEPPPDDQLDGIVSLLPPPRRGSKQLLESDLERPKSPPSHTLSTKLSIVGEPTANVTPNSKIFSISRPGSAMSNHSGHSHTFLEIDWESPKDEVVPHDEYPPEKLPSPVEPVHISLSRPASVVSLGIVTM